MTDKEKRAPVQGFSAGIPWEMHLRAYDAYCKEYSPQPALIDLEGRNCRGGFGVNELDRYIPGWREELSRTNELEGLCRMQGNEIRLLRIAIVRYGDHSRMGTVEPMELQQVIDDAFEKTPTPKGQHNV